CAGVERGRFPRLCDRTNLWSLLMAITAHKSADYLRRQGRQKRRPSGTIKRLDSEPRASGLLHLISREPEPGFAVAIADELEQQLQSLDATGDADLRQIATFRLEGLSQKDIAARLG